MTHGCKDESHVWWVTMFMGIVLLICRICGRQEER